MEPLIYTSRGNMPESELRYEQIWEDSPDMTIFKEFWYASDGELVKNNVHAYGRKSLEMGMVQAMIG